MIELRLAKFALAVFMLVSVAQGRAPAEEAGSSPPHLSFRWPVRGPVMQAFREGETDGIDIGARPGEAVHAAADGVCIAANDDIRTYGKLVVLRHDDGYATVYADLGEIDVGQGDKVRRGQIIAKSGQTGEVATPRLHFELRKDGKPIDPSRYLAPL